MYHTILYLFTRLLSYWSENLRYEFPFTKFHESRYREGFNCGRGVEVIDCRFHPIIFNSLSLISYMHVLFFLIAFFLPSLPFPLPPVR